MLLQGDLPRKQEWAARAGSSGSERYGGGPALGATPKGSASIFMIMTYSTYSHNERQPGS